MEYQTLRTSISSKYSIFGPPPPPSNASIAPILSPPFLLPPPIDQGDLTECTHSALILDGASACAALRGAACMVDKCTFPAFLCHQKADRGTKANQTKHETD